MYVIVNSVLLITVSGIRVICFMPVLASEIFLLKISLFLFCIYRAFYIVSNEDSVLFDINIYDVLIIIIIYKEYNYFYAQNVYIYISIL